MKIFAKKVVRAFIYLAFFNNLWENSRTAFHKIIESEQFHSTTKTKRIRMSYISGYCKKCQKIHTLSSGTTIKVAHQLLNKLMTMKTLDIFSSKPGHHSSFSVDPLFGKSRGKMLGILETLNNKGEKKILYAFSGQYNSQWDIPGWLPPPFSTKDFDMIYNKREKQIKQLTAKIAATSEKDPLWPIFRQQRKKLSQQLNRELQELHRLHNFSGEEARLKDIFTDRGIPTGTGECCTPKLLDYAARHQLKPLGICEFFMGRSNRSGSCKHGRFYQPCANRCQPLLGFMLCGIEKLL